MPPSLQKLSIQDILDAFVIGPEEIKIKDKRYPSRIEIGETRKKLMENLLGLACCDQRLDPMNWGVVLYKENKYQAWKIQTHNAQVIRDALQDERNAENDTTIADALTCNSPKVKARWVGKMITKQGASQQAGKILLPDRTAKNPA